MGHLGGHAVAFRRAHQPVEQHSAERALVDEAQLRAIVGKRDAHMQVPLVGRILGPHQQLSAHPEVGDQALVERPGRCAQRQPEVLAAPRRGLDAGAGQAGGEVGTAGQMAPDRAWVPDLDRGDGAADHPALQAAADGLDLG